jgi:hypothetical protein
VILLQLLDQGVRTLSFHPCFFHDKIDVKDPDIVFFFQVQPGTASILRLGIILFSRYYVHTPLLVIAFLTFDDVYRDGMFCQELVQFPAMRAIAFRDGAD